MEIPELEAVRRAAREQGLDENEIERVLEFISNPTVRPIVGVEEFMNSPHYMGAIREDGESVIWPKVMEELIKMNDGSYDTVVLTGGIGSAKTTSALYALAYQLYLLSCYEDPHKLYDLDPSSEIVFIFQSVTAKAAKDVDYQRFRAMVEKAPYFRDHFPFDKDFESEIKFPKRIIVRPVSSKDTAAIGQNVFGGLIDEVNFMAITEKSKLSMGNEAYDQAEALYNSIASRRASRFGRLGILPGLLCLVSSAKYPGQFTDKRIEESKHEIAKTGKTRIYVYNKRVWDVAPEGKFSGDKFPIFIGDMSHRPRVLTQEEVDNAREWEKPLIDWVPVEFRNKFDQDMMGSLRDIAGHATIARYPFFIELDRVSACLGRTRNLLNKTRCTLVPNEDIIEALPQAIRNPKSPRFAHVDLAISGDSAGLCVGHVEKFLEVQRGSDQYETLPRIVIDLVLEIPPPKNGEILFYRIRELLYNLKEIMGIPIMWVTFDSFQSKDSMQLLRQRGFTTGMQSMDLVPVDPYAFLKSSFYDDRIEIPQCEKLLKELGSLEKDMKTGKVDHPPGGCFTGETRIALANGTCPTFKELAERLTPDDRFYVYSMSPKGICISPARYSRVTKHVTELVEVLLDNYQVIRCTPEHPFMTLDGKWVKAVDLTPEISLMPLYRSVSAKGGWANYERVWCPVREERFMTHQLAAGGVPKGYAAHHVDGNKRNNDPRNIELMTIKAHHKMHADELWASRQAKMREGCKKHFAAIENRDAARERLTELHASGKMRAARTSAQKNHRVLSVTKITVPAEAVYDITVPGLENFALASGVFVHNSKDIADSLAGVCYGLHMRREVWAHFGIPLRQAPGWITARRLREAAAVSPEEIVKTPLPQ